MNDLYRGNAYANDPQFDAFTGRVAYQTSIIGITRDGYKVRCTRVYIDLGRAAPVSVGDPDEVLNTVEDLPHEPLFRRKHTKKTPRANALQDRIVDYMQKHGPTTIPLLSYEWGVVGQTLQKHLDTRTGFVYCKVGYRGGANLWGLVGIHDQEQS